MSSAIAPRPRTPREQMCIIDEYRQCVQPFIDLKLRLFLAAIPIYRIDLRSGEMVTVSDGLSDEARALRDEIDRTIEGVAAMFRKKLL